MQVDWKGNIENKDIIVFEYDNTIQKANILLKNSINQSYSEVSIYFGKSYVKERVRNVLNYKKPRFIVNVVLCLLVLGVSVALGTNKKTPATAVNLNTTNQIDEINADLGELVIYKQKLNSNGNAVDSFEKLEHIKRQIEMLENSDIKDEDKKFYINLYNNIAAEIEPNDTIFVNAIKANAKIKQTNPISIIIAFPLLESDNNPFPSTSMVVSSLILFSKILLSTF